jgi:hypothetical protein
VGRCVLWCTVHGFVGGGEDPVLPVGLQSRDDFNRRTSGIQAVGTQPLDDGGREREP